MILPKQVMRVFSFSFLSFKKADFILKLGEVAVTDH